MNEIPVIAKMPSYDFFQRKHTPFQKVAHLDLLDIC